MRIAPPSGEELEKLLASNAHRHPEKATITVLGDRGVPVKLPFVLGNPSGACRSVAGARSLPAWKDSIAVTLSLKKATADIGDMLVADCILWPLPAEWSAWSERWPALGHDLMVAIRRKYAGNIEALREPGFDELPPSFLEAALAERPRATWRYVDTPGGRLSLVIEPPTAAAWGAFTEAAGKTDAELWQLCSEMVAACVPVIHRLKPGARGQAPESGGVMLLADVLDRWCGLGVVLINEISRLAGAGSEVRLGEW